MFATFPTNCTAALLRFSQVLWTPATVDVVHPCTEWRDVAEHTLRLPRPAESALFDAVVQTLAQTPAYSYANVSTTHIAAETWIPRGTDVFLVIVFYCALTLLSSALLIK
jgi:hypothetical protein